nr:MFS/sugar transport protein [uncultured bacterium]
MAAVFLICPDVGQACLVMWLNQQGKKTPSQRTSLDTYYSLMSFTGSAIRAVSLVLLLIAAFTGRSSRAARAAGFPVVQTPADVAPATSQSLSPPS